MKSNRCFVSIYFEDGLVFGRRRRDVTLAFAEKDILYEQCKYLGSSEIKKIIGINSYLELMKRAKQEGRSLSNLIKHRLRTKLVNEKENTFS